MYRLNSVSFFMVVSISQGINKLFDCPPTTLCRHFASEKKEAAASFLYGE